MRICSVDGCERPLYCRGWCRSHYNKWQRKTRLTYKEADKRFRDANLESRRASVRISNHKLKKEVIEAYGGKCTCCGESRLVFLTIDHIFNDGATEGRHGDSQYRWLRQEGYPKGRHQVLCMNCNWAKRYGVCPHQQEGIDD